MECLVVFVLLVVGAVLLSGWFASSQFGSSWRSRLFESLAKRYGGSFESGGWFGSPNAEFRYGSTRVTIRTSPTSRQPRLPMVQAKIVWPDHPFTCDLQPTPELLLDSTRLSRLADDATDFDVRYQIRGLTNEACQRIFTPAVKWQIERLCLLSEGRHLYVSVNEGALEVYKPLALQQYTELAEFTELVLALFDQLSLASSTGIEFVDEGSVQVISEATCQVCGDEIADEMVFCRRCKTPHHRECWQYYGACSTYGCRETQFFVPRMAKTRDGDDEQPRPGKPR